MKNIILQHWTGELGPLELASKANMEKYAKKMDVKCVSCKKRYNCRWMYVK